MIDYVLISHNKFVTRINYFHYTIKQRTIAKLKRSFELIYGLPICISVSNRELFSIQLCISISVPNPTINYNVIDLLSYIHISLHLKLAY